MREGYIYKITSPSNKIYIGQTVNLYMRKTKYKLGYCKKQPKLYNSIIKYGWNKHIIEIIEIIQIENSRTELDEREIYWIKFYDSLYNGLNCTEGGSSRNNYIISEETRKKLSIASTGRSHTDITKNKISNANMGKVHSDKTKNKIKLAASNHVNSEDTRKKISDALKANHPKVNYDNLVKGLKYCPKCKDTKLLKEFDKSKRYKDGHKTPCKACLILLRQTPEYKIKHAKYSKERYHNYSQSALAPIPVLPIITPS